MNQPRRRHLPHGRTPALRLRVENLEERTLLDVGDTLGAALATGLGPGVGRYVQYQEPLGDGGSALLDVDLYQFTANAGTLLTARTYPGPAGLPMDPFVRLFDAAGNPLAGNDDYRSSLYGRVEYPITTGGTYYVGISGSPNDAYNPGTAGSGLLPADVGGHYGLELSLITAPAVAPDVGDDLLTAQFTNVFGFGAANGYATANRRIGDGAAVALDVDMYSLYASAGTLLTVRTLLPYAGAANVDTMLRLFSLNSTTGAVVQVAANDDAPGTEYGFYSYVTYAVPVDGLYYVGVSGYNNGAYDPYFASSGTAGDVGLYRLEIFLAEAPQALAADVGDTAFDAEFTTFQSYYSKTQRLGDGTAAAQDVDMYLFYALPGTTLLATTSLPPGGVSVDTFLRVFDSSGSELTHNDQGGEGFYSFVSFTVATEDIYYLAVSGNPNYVYSPFVTGAGVNGPSGDYRLDLFLTAPGAGPGSGSSPGGGSGRDGSSITVLLDSEQAADRLVSALLSTDEGMPARNEERVDPAQVQAPQPTAPVQEEAAVVARRRVESLFARPEERALFDDVFQLLA